MNLLLFPIAEISEIIDQTQTAVAGWRKVLDVLDVPIDVSDDPARHDAARRCAAGRGRARRLLLPHRASRPAAT